jgi:multiple sugar transport system permease protein
MEQPAVPGHHRRPEAWRLALGSIVAVLFLAPFVLMLSGSLRPSGAPPPRTAELIPATPGLGNYEELAGDQLFTRSARNSSLVAAIAVPLGVLVASWAGFAIARLPRRAASVLVGVAVVAATIPLTSLFVGRVALFRLLGLTDGPAPLIAPALIGVSPLLILLFAWGYARVPTELYEIARQVGLGPLGTWWHVALPIRLGIAGAAAAIAFVLTWGNFLDPLVYVYDERWYTLPLSLRSMAALPPTEQPLMLAGAVITALPVLVVFLLLQWRVSGRGA